MLDPKTLEDDLLVLEFENEICNRQRATINAKTRHCVKECDERIRDIRTEIFRRLRQTK